MARNNFTVPGKYPFEEIVDFMLVDIPYIESGFAFICISGYYAGTLEFELPKEARNANARSISVNWLINNWNTWVYSECSIQEVFILEANVPTAM